MELWNSHTLRGERTRGARLAMATDLAVLLSTGGELPHPSWPIRQG
jgi:hypothetical protein